MTDVIIKNAGISDIGAKVRAEGQLETFSVMVNELENVSARVRLGFSWVIVPADFANAATLLLVQNDSDSLVLHIEKVIIETDNNSYVQIHLTDRAALTPAGGTLVTGVCWNQTAPRVAAAIARSNETANAQGNIIWDFECIADTIYTVELYGAVLLAKGQSIAVDLTTAATSLAGCQILGFFAQPDEERR
jgi:hypothetical protein